MNLWMRLSRRWGVAALAVVASAAPAAPARSQAPPAGADSMTLPMPAQIETLAVYVVRRVDPPGTLVLEIKPEVARMLPGVSGTEGYHVLMIPGGSGRLPRIYRGLVADVGGRGSLTIQVGEAATREIRPGEAVWLARPLGGTTALMKALPDVIPIAGGDPQAALDEQAAARQAANLTRSINNLKQIGLAMHNYASSQGAFPPAVIYGPDGKPWHSWRVLILPYLEQNSLFQQYDFTQPWDSEKNRKVLEAMPAVYRDPIHGDDAGGTTTHYAVLTGPSTLFPATGTKMAQAKPGGPEMKGLGIAQITDGTSNTVMVVPVAPDRKIPWTKPEDIAFNGPAGFPAMGAPGGIAAPYRVGGKADGLGLSPLLFADGSVRSVSADIRGQVLAALITRNGGEVISSDAIPGGRSTQPQGRMIRFTLDGGRTTATVEPLAIPGQSPGGAAPRTTTTPPR